MLKIMTKCDSRGPRKDIGVVESEDEKFEARVKKQEESDIPQDKVR